MALASLQWRTGTRLGLAISNVRTLPRKLVLSRPDSGAHVMSDKEARLRLVEYLVRLPGWQEAIASHLKVLAKDRSGRPITYRPIEDTCNRLTST